MHHEDEAWAEEHHEVELVDSKSTRVSKEANQANEFELFYDHFKRSLSVCIAVS